MSRFRFSALAASVTLSVLALAAPAYARPAATDEDAAAGTPRADAAEDLPTDGRPIVATVVAIDETALRIMLSTPHGPVALSVSQDVVDRLSVGDVIVVQFTSEDDYPSASPPAEEQTRSDRLRI